MRFRNYCIVVMNDTKGALDEITKISETNPNVLDAKGILIATFSSIAEPNELTEWFTECNRNFLLFDLSPKSAGFNIIKKEIHDGLFGFLKDINIDDMNEKFSQTIDIETKLKPIRNTTKNKIDPKKIESMGSKERQELLNELIEYGLEKLTDEDKKLLPLLAE